jgi:NAD(P)-dependent dehydrogenase (short-subunit alcohol dehydrogenase family)
VSSAKKIVLIAGGTGGLGRAASLAFVLEGAAVNVTYQRLAEWESLKNGAAASGGSLKGYHVDVTHEAAVVEMMEQIVVQHGRLDALVNTVGGYVGGINLWETDPKAFERMLALNLRSGLVLSRVAARQMLKQGSGVIVNVAAKAAVDHGAGATAYASSKAAALAMIDSLAADLKGTGVRANSILPSIIDTEANRKAMPQADFSKWPKPEDIARVILFLCSDAAKVIQGAAIPVYGDS